MYIILFFSAKVNIKKGGKELAFHREAAFEASEREHDLDKSVFFTQFHLVASARWLGTKFMRIIKLCSFSSMLPNGKDKSWNGEFSLLLQGKSQRVKKQNIKQFSFGNLEN